MRWGALLAAALLAAAPPALAHGQAGGPYWGYGDHMMWGGGWGWLFGPLMMILWIVLLVGAVVLVLRWLGVTGGPGAGRGAEGRRDALDILRERFARGEIDVEEFERRRALLER